MWKDFAIRKMKDAGFKLTPQRLKLIEIIEEIGRKHPSLKQVYYAMKEEFPTISFSTLYSNLLILKSLNLIDFFTLEGETRIEMNCKPHFNIITDTGVRDLVDDRLMKRVEKRVGRKIRMVNVFVDDQN